MLLDTSELAIRTSIGCCGGRFARLSPGRAREVTGRVSRGRLLAEREDVRAHARSEERNLEGALGDGAGLEDELVHPRLGNDALAGLVDVDAVGITRRLTVEPQGEANRGSRRRRREDQVEVARLEAVRDRTGGRLEHGVLLAHRPRAAEGPVVERECVSAPVAAALAAGVADVGLRGPQGVPVGGLRETVGVDPDGLLLDAQEPLDRTLAL